MGKRGPKPTPTATLKLRGSWRGDINKNEPSPDKGMPDCPPEVQGVAKECWEQIAPMLNDMGVLTKADGMALSLLCETFAHWRRAQDLLTKHGDVYPIKDEAGKVKYLQQTPYVSITRNFGKALKEMLCEFGLTPSARSRIETTGDKQTVKADERISYLTG